MKPYTLFICGAMLAGLASCSSEDAPEAVRDTITDCFAPDPDATDAESVLRRSFKQDEGSYLLFTDTLTHEYLGKDYNGDDRYKTETLDMSYKIGNTASAQVIKYEYTYLTTMAEKEASVAFLKEYVLPHLPSSLRPFSWFLAKSIYNSTDYTDVTALSGQRAIAVAVGDLETMDKDAVATEVLSTALGTGLASKEEELQAFYDVCDGLYEEYFDTSENPGYDIDVNMMLLNRGGFITPYVVWGFTIQGKYPTKAQDMTSFTSLVLNYTEAEIEDMYGSYPVVIQKAKLLRSIIEQVGYIF